MEIQKNLFILCFVFRVSAYPRFYFNVMKGVSVPAIMTEPTARAVSLISPTTLPQSYTPLLQTWSFFFQWVSRFTRFRYSQWFSEKEHLRITGVTFIHVAPEVGIQLIIHLMRLYTMWGNIQRNCVRRIAALCEKLLILILTRDYLSHNYMPFVTWTQSCTYF